MKNLLQQQLPAVPWSLQFSHLENGGQLPDACEVEPGEEIQAVPEIVEEFKCGFTDSS